MSSEPDAKTLTPDCASLALHPEPFTRPRYSLDKKRQISVILSVKVPHHPSDGRVVNRLMNRWGSPPYAYFLLTILTLACLLPFSGRAFHVDDPLFIWTARQITEHPLDPYGFSVNWFQYSKPVAEETKNPPLAAYYAASVGKVTGLWSERIFHIAFLAPALAFVLGTYRLASRFTCFPLLAAAATLLTPGVLVSACSVMSDTMMVALWLWAVILWIEGLERQSVWRLGGAAVLIAASALTKYFAASLILLLAAYSFARTRSFKGWIWYLPIPVGVLLGYELWTRELYGHGLVSDANNFARVHRHGLHFISRAFTSLSFMGGCALSVLTFAPVVWSRKALTLAAFGGGLAACALIFGWAPYGIRAGGELAFNSLRSNWELVGIQLAIFIAGGIVTLALAITDYLNRRSADSLLLGLWVIGTWAFTGFLNWTVNARTVLPMIPAATILVMRRLEQRQWTVRLRWQTAGALIVSAFVSMWIAASDARLANTEREAAHSMRSFATNPASTLWFEGHWGFQYYMEQLGAQAVDAHNFEVRPGENVVVQDNGLPLWPLPTDFFCADETALEFRGPVMATTIGWRLGAGFYDSYFGPLPYAFGRIPAERYRVLRACPSQARASTGAP